MFNKKSCRVVLAASTLAIAGCSDGGLTGPDPRGAVAQAAMAIEGFPATQRIRTGENVLLSLKGVGDDVESIRWVTSDVRVASLVATPAVSPCGSACAWLRGESAGSARVEAVVCTVDGSCVSVRRARVATANGTLDLDAAFAVTN
jgi:hypothetical protein